VQLFLGHDKTDQSSWCDTVCINFHLGGEYNQEIYADAALFENQIYGYVIFCH